MPVPKIIALDLDGTLFSGTGEVTPYTKEMLRRAVKAGVSIIISTGRPFTGLPFDVAKETGIEYAITANGAGVYRIADRACLHEEGLAPKTAADLCLALRNRHLHLDDFIQGEAYTQNTTFEIIRRSVLPESVKNYILTTRNQTPDLAAYILEHNLTLQKATCTFEKESDGQFPDREETRQYLESRPEIHVVCGGYHNLEFTKAGVTKGAGLRFLCDYLHIPLEASMACGDSENDLDILKTSGLSVAMSNADAAIKDACDYVTASCNEDGVGLAIAKYIFHETR